MKLPNMMLLGVSVVWILLPALGSADSCPSDSVRVGSVCVDKYEASVWSLDPTNKGLIGKVQQGKVALSHLREGGAVQRGANADDYDLANCPDTGNGCTSVYAVSLPGVTPARLITWFQAAAACRNSGKRLLTNAEWQVAALGTPDPGAAGDGVTTCNTAGAGLMPTGSARACVSDVGAFDMVGNLWEWVADWIQGDTNPWAPVTGGKTNSAYGNDFMSGTNPAQTQGNGQNFPAAIERGGSFDYGNLTDAGVFALSAAQSASGSFTSLGFRCGR